MRRTPARARRRSRRKELITGHVDAYERDQQFRYIDALRRRAQGLLVHTDEAGESGVHTGTLLKDADPSTDVPYLQTAHHRVPGQCRASRLETCWFLKASRCGGPRGDVRSLAGGAELLYAEQTIDTSFLELRNPPPPGALFSDWASALPAVGTGLAGLRHPRGGVQRIAFGTLAEYLNCEDVACCGETANPGELHYLLVRWSAGATSGGSSGSELFLETGQLVGVLPGGFSHCDNQGGSDDYGRFDLAYREALRRWIGPGGAGNEPNPDARSRSREVRRSKYRRARYYEHRTLTVDR